MAPQALTVYVTDSGRIYPHWTVVGAVLHHVLPCGTRVECILNVEQPLLKLLLESTLNRPDAGGMVFIRPPEYSEYP
jgi:hypothetical protein